MRYNIEVDTITEATIKDLLKENTKRITKAKELCRLTRDGKNIAATVRDNLDAVSELYWLKQEKHMLDDMCAAKRAAG